MKLIIVSGRSGSGKSTCLNVLEDLGYYCVDNIPASLTASLVDRIRPDENGEIKHVAASIDARNIASDLNQFTNIYDELQTVENLDLQIIYLDAEDNTLLKRYSETRRKHPLSNQHISLPEAIAHEKKVLSNISSLATFSVDTTNLSIYQLRDVIKNNIVQHDGQGVALLFQSFGFKHSLPPDADIVFDARCLPNPYWESDLRKLSGLDDKVQIFLEAEPLVLEFLADIRSFLEQWLPRYEANNRSYITVAIGCTGGQHRSVYLCEKLREHFSQSVSNVQVRHKEFA